MKHATFAFIDNHQDIQGNILDCKRPNESWEILVHWIGSTPCNGTFTEELTHWERDKLSKGLGSKDY